MSRPCERDRDGLPPATLRVRVDRDVRVREGGRVLVGGVPARLLRLSDEGASVVAGWVTADAIGEGHGRRRLARRLLDAGILLTDPADAPGPAPAVVVPAHGRAVQLERCLAAVRADLPDAEVLVVDDGSPDAAALVAVAARHRAGIVRHPRRRGPAAARNTGTGHTAAELVAFVDSDVVVDRGTLRRLAAHFADPGTAAMAPRVLGAIDAAGLIGAYEARHSSLDMGDRAAPVAPGGRVPYVPSTVLMVRRAAVAEIPFDEELEVGEDVDLVWRLVGAGWRVGYDPSVAVRHDHRTSPGAFVRRRFAYATSIGSLATRHPGELAAVHADVLALGASALAATGRRRAAAGLVLLSTARLRSLLAARSDRPTRLALELAGRKHVALAAALARAARRPWSPLVLAAGVVAPRRAAATFVIVQAAQALERRASPRELPLLLADDVISATGTWWSCWQQRTVRPLLPASR